MYVCIPVCFCSQNVCSLWGNLLLEEISTADGGGPGEQVSQCHSKV